MNETPTRADPVEPRESSLVVAVFGNSRLTTLKAYMTQLEQTVRMNANEMRRSSGAIWVHA